jgi:pyruvyl transferase EpsO
MNYIDHMQGVAKESFDVLFDGVPAVYFTDFPDHPNVGDSAIALGQLTYFRMSDIRVEGIYCIGTFPKKLLRSRTPVVINGGGNIAGLFWKIDDHRYRLGRDLRSSTTLIQAPQSIHFATPEAKVEFGREFAERSELRFAVRDERAIADLKGLIEDPILAPDAVHHLGAIDAPAPSKKIVVLARTDRESSGLTGSINGEDWPREKGLLKFTSRVRWKGSWLGPLGGLVNPSAARWELLANLRLQRGIRILSEGETVITDRLHAMLISLQMGRRVIAIDNNNQKLSKYAATWFGSSNPDVRFVRSFDEAVGLEKLD